MKRILVLVAVAWTTACVHSSPVVTPTVPATRPVVIRTCVDQPSLTLDAPEIPGPTHTWSSATTGTVDAAGNWAFELPVGMTAFNLHGRAVGYPPYDPVVHLPAQGNRDLNIDGCQPVTDPSFQTALPAWAALNFDPSSLTLEQLAAIRGAMWTATANLPYGPYPNQDRNSIAFDYYQFFSAPDRARMIDAYRARSYTHVVTGPVAGTDCYHGQYPCHDPSFPAVMPVDGPPTQSAFNAYLDALQELWNARLMPICFIKPDGWENHLDWLDALDALYQQPRAQKLCRIVVYPGWEPSGSKYGWDNDTWLYFVQRGARVFPHALRLLHTPADLDAPTGGEDENRGYTNDLAWRFVAPYIHGWLSQWGGYATADDCTPTADFKQAFADALKDSVGRFATGRAGWPTSSAWGIDRPVLTYAGEYASYIYFRRGCAEQPSLDLGDIAVSSGVFGYLDGGRLPVRAVP